MTARPTLPADAAAFAAQIPYAFAKSHGVLAAGVDGDAVVVLTRPDATPDGVVEIRRVLQRPLITRAVSAEQFAAELARAYNQGAPSAAATWADDLARETDLTRLMQDLPSAEDLLDSSTQAPVIRMINALLLQALRERASDLHFEPYEARSVVRFRVDGSCATSSSRRARCMRRWCRGSRSWPAWTSRKSACRRTAASRSSWATSRWTSACPRCRPAPASAWCCGCWTRIRRAST